MQWSEEYIGLLKQLWSDGKSAAEIAAELTLLSGSEISRNAVIGKAHRLQLSGRPSPIIKKVRRGVGMTGLNERMCKWPVGDPRTPEFHFCGVSVQLGTSYCDAHRQVAYQRRDREKPILRGKGGAPAF